MQRRKGAPCSSSNGSKGDVQWKKRLLLLMCSQVATGLAGAHSSESVAAATADLLSLASSSSDTSESSQTTQQQQYSHAHNHDGQHGYRDKYRLNHPFIDPREQEECNQLPNDHSYIPSFLKSFLEYFHTQQQQQQVHEEENSTARTSQLPCDDSSAYSPCTPSAGSHHGRFLKSSDDGSGSNDQNGDVIVDDDDRYYDDDDDTGRYDNDEDDYYKFIDDSASIPSLKNLQRRDVIGFFLASLGATLGSAGGIGGGGLVVPIYIIAMGLSPRYAFPLGSATAFGGSLAGMMMNLRRRHPLADRPLIDWDLVLMMEPLVLVGALVGGLIHRYVSEDILIVLLVLLLSVSAHYTLAKAKRMHEAEVRYIEHLKAARHDAIMRQCSFKSAFRTSGWSIAAIPGGTIQGVGSDHRAPDSINLTRTMSLESRAARTLSPDGSKMDEDEKQRILILNPDFVTLRSDLLEQEKATPRSKIIALCCKFSILMFLNLQLGTGDTSSDNASSWTTIECNSVAFWVVHVIMIAFLFAAAWAAQTYLINRHEIKEIVNYDYVQGDIKWEPRNAIIYPSFFIGAGMCAGCFGIGGGLITVPVMLAMGVHPSVVTSTSSVMVFFTAVLSGSTFAIFGMLLVDYGIACLLLGFFASLIGQGIMSRARQARAAGANFERNSIIAYCIGFVILLSALLMTVEYMMYAGIEDDEEERSGFCDGYSAQPRFN